MLKLAYLGLPGSSLLLVSLLGQGAIAGPSPIPPQLPTASTPLCYLQLKQQVINLNSLCGASNSGTQLSPMITIKADDLTGSSQQSGVQSPDFAALSSTGKMWDVNTTSQRQR